MGVLIVGGGAAGLMAACRLADLSAEVTLFERNDRLGRKLAITGKGRCNLTNNTDVQTVLSSIPTNPRFLYSALDGCSPQDVMEYFENKLGVPLKTERGNRVFPRSDHASDVVSALKRHIEGKVKIVNHKVTAIKAENGVVTGVFCGERFYPGEKILLATGGASYTATGSDGFGYKLASALGHEIVEPTPSLVPLECVGSIPQALMGLSLKNTAIKVEDTEKRKIIYEDFGEMLFTHFGLSGPMILSASAHMKKMRPSKYKIHIDLKPALDPTVLDKRLLSDFAENINRDFSNALSGLLPSKMIPVILSLSGIEPHRKVNSITKEERAHLTCLLKDLTLTVRGFRPINEAIITSGGVNVKEINPKTMESKLISGLYFSGEIIDVDGYTGGFNLQIAFATATLAARRMAQTE